MKRILGSMFAVAAMLAGQCHAQSSQPQVLQLQAPATRCPIGFEARHGVGGGTMFVRNGHPNAIAQPLSVTVENRDGVGITGIEFTAHGVTAKGRVTPLGGNDISSDIAKTINIGLTVDAKKHASADLLLNRFTAVLYLDLDSVTYADGSSWHSSPVWGCRVYPDGFMLVDAH